MSYLPQSKFGNCSQCPAKDVACRKVGKDLWCLDKCYRNKKAKEQIDKAKLKQQVRGLNIYQKENNSEVVDLQKWFEARRREMTGFCVNCGDKTLKDDDKYYKYSIAHLLPKAYFISIKTHESNWLELCYFGKGCHSMMDTHMVDLIDMNCFDEIVTKFCKIYPSIAKEEKRRIPMVLLQYI